VDGSAVAPAPDSAVPATVMTATIRDSANRLCGLVVTSAPRKPPAEMAA
jgi:hypothetical protein